MNRIIEIPIYALDEKTLFKRYTVAEEKCRKELIDTIDATEEQIRRCLEIEYYPQRLWQYNHIVGYILIAIDSDDLLMNVYKIEQAEKTHYFFSSHVKQFLVDVSPGGYHINLYKATSNEEIRQIVAKWIQSACNDTNLIPKRWFVDRDKFDLVNPHLDYLGIYETIKKQESQHHKSK